MIVLSRLGHFRKKTFIFIVILLVLFFYSTLLIINSKNKLDFSTSEGFMNSMKIYGGWLANGFNNLKVITGNALKMDWSSTNGTFIEKSKNNSIKISNRPAIKK